MGKFKKGDNVRAIEKNYIGVEGVITKESDSDGSCNTIRLTKDFPSLVWEIGRELIFHDRELELAEPRAISPGKVERGDTIEVTTTSDEITRKLIGKVTKTEEVGFGGVRLFAGKSILYSDGWGGDSRTEITLLEKPEPHPLAGAGIGTVFTAHPESDKDRYYRYVKHSDQWWIQETRLRPNQEISYVTAKGDNLIEGIFNDYNGKLVDKK